MPGVRVAIAEQHGTVAGYRRHYAAGEPRCQPCKDAQAEAGRLRKAGQEIPRALLGEVVECVAECGTWAGVRRHERRGEQLDEACLEARRWHDRERYARDDERREVVKAASLARYYAGRELPRGELPPRMCPVCWQEFTPNTGQRRYCGEDCAALAIELRQPGRLMELRLASPKERVAIVARIAARRQSPSVELRADRYNAEHFAERRRRLDERGPDARCARGGELLPEDERLIDLDHLDEGGPRDYLGLSCQSCNRGRRPIVAVRLAS